ncbi:hypothetical protein [Pectobacterium carotovorum]|uniref:hypothetical protein n=1 Tax=Pectobacterium carotovorum TaxID=554 RepID=UPI0005831592|nr:hypothetical protein [Pectobacterium carotovorum]KHS84630.1 hypothetical protein RC84_10315 [Pectobacterium carotovorum subsp. carotovorum]
MKAAIELKTERDVRLFLWLNKKDISIINYATTSSLKNYNLNQMYGRNASAAENAINEAFSIFYKDPDQLNSYSISFKRKKEGIIHLDEFNWLSKCHDSCYFTWVFIRVFCRENEFLLDGFFTSVPKINVLTIYNYLDLPLYPVSHQERFQSIIDFFDRINFNLISKMNLMFFIKNKWHEHYHLKNNLPLSRKDKNKCEWLWNYINKDKSNIVRGSKKRESSSFINNSIYGCMETSVATHLHSPSFLSLFRPSGYNEMYLALNCIYIFLYHRDGNFIPRIKKAWESSVFRKSNKSNKKTKVKLESTNEVRSGKSDNNNYIKPVSEIDEKRMKAKEIMREITEKANSNVDDGMSNNNNELPWYG